MPNSINAKKALRKSHTRRLRNRVRRSALRTRLKQFRVLAEAGEDKDAIETAFRAAVKGLDKAAAKGLIHKNKAARTKSRLSKLCPRRKG